MDGSAFTHLGFRGAPVLFALAALGFLACLGGVAAGAWWVISHLHWS